MKFYSPLPFLAGYFSIVSGLHAQSFSDATAIKVFNFSTFPENTIPAGVEELQNLVDPAYYAHPEFGILPADAPCEDCIELIDRRTSNTRYYVKSGTSGKKFYSQASVTDLHYTNGAGQLITIEPHIRPVEGSPGIFKAAQQPDPTTLNMPEGFTSIELMDHSIFKFNQSIISYSTDDFNTFENVNFINRSDYSAGADGALVKNALGNIDQQLIFDEARIKSSYILKDLSAINTAKNYFVIEDAFTLPDGYHLSYDPYEGNMNDLGFWHGDLILENASGIEVARVDAPVIYDSNPSDSVQIPDRQNIISYLVEQTGNSCKLKLIVTTSFLSSADRVFPITIDPTVFGATATWTGVSGTDDSPTFCTVTLSVPTPAMATLTGSSVYWEFVASGVICGPFCKLKYMQVRIGTSCGYSPSAAGVWVCPLCNTAGTWLPIVDDATTAALVSCNPPQCTSYDIPFTLYHNQYQCVTAGGCVTTCDYMQKFQVTIEGETVTGLATVEGGTTTYTVVNCADQSGWLGVTTPNYGVPGYTYSWTPIGATTASVYVTYPMGTTNYTVTITDACGNTYTDVVTVINNCLTLPLELLSFSGFQSGNMNVLNWTIARENKDENFIIERSATGIDFEQIGSVESASGSFQTDFTFTDRSPHPGINYYRLKQLRDAGDPSYSDMISIRSGITDQAEIIVHPQDGAANELSLTILSPEKAETIIKIYDIAGKLVVSQPVSLFEGNTSTIIDIRNLSKGSYVIALNINSITTETKFIK